MKKYLLFDADNTLFDFNKASKVAFKETLSSFNIPQKEETYATYVEINNKCWKQLENGEITPQEIKSLRFQLFLDAVEAEGNPLLINDFYLERLAEKDYLLEGARDLLDDLKVKNFSLSIVTNGLKIVQRPRIAKAGLTSYFDAITVSEEIGIAKPHIDFFKDTFKQLDHPYIDDVLVIGDNLFSDILGGQNIGADTIWFNPKEKKNDTQVVPTFDIKNFEEMRQAIHYKR